MSALDSRLRGNDESGGAYWRSINPRIPSGLGIHRLPTRDRRNKHYAVAVGERGIPVHKLVVNHDAKAVDTKTESVFFAKRIVKHSGRIRRGPDRFFRGVSLFTKNCEVLDVNRLVRHGTTLHLLARNASNAASYSSGRLTLLNAKSFGGSSRCVRELIRTLRGQ